MARTLALTPIGDATPAVGTATALARWLAVNVHAVTDGQLTDVLSAYARLSYGDPLVTAALERYVTTKVRIGGRSGSGQGRTRSGGHRFADVESEVENEVENEVEYEVRNEVERNIKTRGGTIPEITMRYVSRYLSHDTIRIMILH